MCVGSDAGLVERVAGVEAHLPAGPRDAEQLVGRDRGEERDRAQPAGDLDAGQRLEPQRAPPIRLEPQPGQRPRRRLEDVPVA